MIEFYKVLYRYFQLIYFVIYLGTVEVNIGRYNNNNNNNNNNILI